MMNTIIDNLKKLEQRYLCSMKASVPRMRSAGLLAGVLAFVWWCVLYPSLCFLDAANAVVPEEGKQKLQNVLTEEEYAQITTETDFRIKWYFLERGKDKKQ